MTDYFENDNRNSNREQLESTFARPESENLEDKIKTNKLLIHPNYILITKSLCINFQAARETRKKRFLLIFPVHTHAVISLNNPRYKIIQIKMF